MGIVAVAILAAVLGGVGYVVTRGGGNAAPPPTTPVTAVTGTSQGPPTISPPAAPVAPQAVTPSIITRADSVRIAAAVAKRVAASNLRDSLAKAKLAEETQRKMMDSIIAANSGAPAAVTAPRRLVIAELFDQKQWPEASLLARAVSDSLRRMLRARSRQFTVVDMDSARAVVARTRDIYEINKSLGTELIVAIRLQALPRDSALLVIQANDEMAVNSNRRRTAGGRPVPKSQVLTNLDQILLTTVTYLDEMTRAPRRPTASP
jgi:TolB-like protein